MKKMITSVGLVAFSAANLQAEQYAPAPNLSSLQTTKPWSVAATLRGFYDDNYTTASVNKLDSFGFEVSPSAKVNWTLPQTYIGLSYAYGMRFYEDRDNNRADHSHQADLNLNHTFTPNYKLDLSDSFVYSREPEISAGGTSVIRRTNTGYYRNRAGGHLTAGLTEKLSTTVGYSNTFYRFDDDAAGRNTLSALLDRTEHLPTIDLRWQVQPSTVAILGYQYGIVNYDDSNRLYSGASVFQSSIRDSNSHYIMAGVDHTFDPQFSASLRAGVQLVEWDELNTQLAANALPSQDDTQVSPYIDASVTKAFSPDTSAQLGVRHSRQSTDVAFFNASNPTLDQEATTIYGQVSHQILPRLSGSLLAQYQMADFQAGGADGRSDNFFLAGINLSYEINQFLAAEAGYNFDDLDSDIPNRGFSRNRVYLGIRASY